MKERIESITAPQVQAQIDNKLDLEELESLGRLLHEKNTTLPLIIADYKNRQYLPPQYLKLLGLKQKDLRDEAVVLGALEQYGARQERAKAELEGRLGSNVSVVSKLLGIKAED